MEVLWQHDGNQVAFRVSIFPDEYADRSLYLWKRTKDKDMWSPWQQVECLEVVNYAPCIHDDCSDCHNKAMDSSLYDLVSQLVDDAAKFKDHFKNFNKRIKSKTEAPSDLQHK